MTVIYLVRHGETKWNVEQRVQGQSDIPLNSTGKKQAERLGLRFKDQKLSAVYASDLIRAKNTAKAVADHHNLSVHTFMDLRERKFGRWEGKTFQEAFGDQARNRWRIIQREEGIESHAEAGKRMLIRLTSIAKQHLNEHVLVVSHGGAINSFLGIISAGAYGPGKTRLANTSVSELHFAGEDWMIRTVNDQQHLKDFEV